MDPKMPNRNCKKREAKDTSDSDVTKKSKTVCVFCLSSEDDEIQFGEILRKGDLTCHYFCLLLSSGLYQNAKPNEKSGLRGFLLVDIRSEVRRGCRLKCCYCQEKGATLGCCAKRCKKTFHLPCGRANGSLHHFFGGFGSYCDDHCPKQSPKDREYEKIDGLECNICLGPLEETLPSVSILHSPCCNNSWFHRSCIQRFAISAGIHHFRCPLCNCGKQFLKEMQHFGIYVPDQDASWERQTGAYNELLERHNTCDADLCTCSLGRNHDAGTGKYNLLLCSCCGSFGSHRTCRGLVWHESSLMCPFCVEIEKNFVGPEKKARLKESATLSSGASNSQSEASTSSTMQEKIIHLEMADDGEFVDIDNDDSDIHVPPFLRNSLSRKIVRRAVSLPSCSLVLQKIDEVIPLLEDSVNVAKIPGFTYCKRKGYLIRSKTGFKQSCKLPKRSKSCYATNGDALKIEGQMQQGKTMENIDGKNGKKSALIKQFDENETEENIMDKSFQKVDDRARPLKNTTNNRKRDKIKSKARTSPLSVLKKQRALKFLMNFNQVTEKKHCRNRCGKNFASSSMKIKTVSQSGSKNKLVQPTLNFFKSKDKSLQTAGNVCRSITDPLTRHIDTNDASTDKNSLCLVEGTKGNIFISTTIHKRKAKANKKTGDASSCKKRLHLVKETTDHSSVATTPHKRLEKVDKNSKDVSCEKRLDLGKDTTDHSSVATTPHKRLAKVDKDSKDASSCKKRLDLGKDTTDHSSVATTPHKRLEKVDKNSKDASCEKRLDLGKDTTDHSSVATTPHKRLAKVDKDSKDASSCKKRLDLGKDTTDHSFVATTPRKRLAKVDKGSKNASSCKKRLDLGKNTTDHSSVATTPHKRLEKVDNDSKDASSCKKRLDLGKNTTDHSSVATTPHKRLEKVDNDSKDASSCKKRLDLGKDTTDHSSVATTPRKRLEKVDNDSKNASSCKKRFDLGKDTTDHSSVATTPHKRLAKADNESKNASSCKKRLDLGKDTTDHSSVATTPHKRLEKFHRDSKDAPSCKKRIDLQKKTRDNASIENLSFYLYSLL